MLHCTEIRIFNLIFFVKGIEFGDQVLSAQGICTSASKDNSRKKEKVKEDLSGYATSLFSYASRMGKHGNQHPVE